MEVEMVRSGSQELLAFEFLQSPRKPGNLWPFSFAGVAHEEENQINPRPFGATPLPHSSRRRHRAGTGQGGTARADRADRLHQPGGPADGHVLYARVVARPDDEPVLQKTARPRLARRRRRRRRGIDGNRLQSRGSLSADGTGKLACDRRPLERTAAASAGLTIQGKNSSRLLIG